METWRKTIMYAHTQTRLLRAAASVAVLGLAGLIAAPLLAGPVSPFYGFIAAPALLLTLLAAAGYVHARLQKTDAASRPGAAPPAVTLEHAARRQPRRPHADVLASRPTAATPAPRARAA